MATQILARNRTKSNPENKVGTNSETLTKIPCEFIGESEGYRAQEIASPFALMKWPPNFHQARLRPNQHGSAIA
jgi:hypothetical protein